MRKKENLWSVNEQGGVLSSVFAGSRASANTVRIPYGSITLWRLS